MAQMLIVSAAALFIVSNATSATYSYGGGGYGGSGADYGSGAYHGPLAAPVVLDSGYLADIGDVAAAKSAHFSALLNAKASSGYGGGYGGGYEGGYGGGSAYGSGAGFGDGTYHGPLAAPVVLSSGYLADTKEVAAAKNAHYSALLSAKANSGYEGGYGGGYGSGYGGGYGSGYGSGATYGGGAYHGPLAAPVVLSSGYLADTKDVAAAKGAHYVALSQASSGYYGKH